MASGTIKTNKTFIKTHLKQNLTFTADNTFLIDSISNLTDGRYQQYGQINYLQKIASGGNSSDDVYYKPATTQQSGYINFAIGHIE